MNNISTDQIPTTEASKFSPFDDFDLYDYERFCIKRQELIERGYSVEEAERLAQPKAMDNDKIMEPLKREQERQLRWLMKDWKKEPKPKKKAKTAQFENDQIPEIVIGSADLEWLERCRAEDGKANQAYPIV